MAHRGPTETILSLLTAMQGQFLLEASLMFPAGLRQALLPLQQVQSFDCSTRCSLDLHRALEINGERIRDVIRCLRDFGGDKAWSQDDQAISKHGGPMLRIVQNMRAYRCPITPAPSMWDASSTKARFSFTDILKMAHTAATESRIWATACPDLYWRTYWYAVTDILLNEHTARMLPMPSLAYMQASNDDLRPELDRRQRVFIGMEEYYTEQIDKFEIAEKQIQAAVLALLAHWKKGATINPML